MEICHNLYGAQPQLPQTEMSQALARDREMMNGVVRIAVLAGVQLKGGQVAGLLQVAQQFIMIRAAWWATTAELRVKLNRLQSCVTSAVEG